MTKVGRLGGKRSRFVQMHSYLSLGIGRVLVAVWLGLASLFLSTSYVTNDSEQAHITSPRGRFWEIVLSLRFFIFQYGVVYSLSATGNRTSLNVSLKVVQVVSFPVPVSCGTKW